MFPDDPDIFKTYTREIIPGGCRQTDLATGEYEDFSCITCHGGQPGTCDDYSKAQELLEKTQVMQKETGSYLERLEEMVRGECNGQLSIVYSHDHWKATLENVGEKNLKVIACTLHEALENLMNEYITERELKFKQILYQKIRAVNKSVELSKPLRELRQKILDAQQTSTDRE